MAENEGRRTRSPNGHDQPACKLLESIIIIIFLERWRNRFVVARAPHFFICDERFSANGLCEEGLGANAHRASPSKLFALDVSTVSLLHAPPSSTLILHQPPPYRTVRCCPAHSHDIAQSSSPIATDASRSSNLSQTTVRTRKRSELNRPLLHMVSIHSPLQLRFPWSL